MNRLRRLWHRWHHHPPPSTMPLTREQERAFGFLAALVRLYDGAIDDEVRQDFEQFARDIEQDRRIQRGQHRS